MAFDENKYKKIFESRFGSGSYESGLSNARQIGQLKAQADYAKKSYNDYQTKAKAASKKKTYTDAVDYFKQNKDAVYKDSVTGKDVSLSQDGGYRFANYIKNNPIEMQRLKDVGFNKDDIVNAIYNAASDGKFQSEGSYDQYTSDIKRQVKAEADGLTSPKTNNNQTDKTVSSKQKQQSLLPPVKSKKQSEKKDNRNGFEKVIDTLNAPLKAFDKNVYQPVEKKVERLATSFTDGLVGGQLKKNVTKDNSPKFVQEAASKPTSKTDKVIDTVGEFAGMVAPVSGSYKVTAPLLKPLSKLLPQAGKLGTVSKIAQTSARGALGMGTYGAAREGLDELLHPNDANFAERAKRVRNDALTGALLDPAFSVGGAAVKKGIETASNRTMQKLLPTQQEIQSALTRNVNSIKSDHALPKTGGVQNVGSMLDALPKSTDIANPNYVSSLLPKPKSQLTIPKVGTPLEETLANPIGNINQSTAISPKVDTSHIDNEIGTVTQQLEQIKNQPKSKTKTQINDELRSLDINDAYLQSSKQKGKISNDEYYRKIQENEAKREALVNENKAYSNDIHDNLKVNWNNESKSYELGNYSAKKVYGGGYSVKNGNETVQKFRTEEEAKRFMQESVGKEQGIPVSFDKEGVLNFKSTFNEANNNWDIQAGDYSIHRSGKDSWTVTNKDQTIGTYKTEKKAREQAQRHLDNQPKQSDELTQLQQRLNTLTQQRESLLNTPSQTNLESIQQAGTPVNTNTLEPSVRPLDSTPRQSENVSVKPNERKHYSTIGNSEKVSPELLDRINQADKTYKPMSNQELVDFANEHVSRDMEQAYQFVKNSEKRDPRHIAVAYRLIDELQKTGQFDKALDVVDTIAEHGTKAGQNVQAFSLYNRLTPEGQLLRAQRRVNKINENITDPTKQVKLNEQNIQDITHAADSIQKMTGQEEQTNNVIKIMDSIKNGKTATDAELETVRSFVTDAKKFIGDLNINGEKVAPKAIKDVRVRDKVVEHMNSAEEAARLRIQARRNRANSLPVDIFYDYTVIGAAKIAKGTVKFADFSEQMIKEFGDEIKPYIQQVYNKAVDTFNKQSETMTAKRLSEVEKITNKALKDKNLSTDEAETIREFARKVGQMSGDAKIEHSMELQSVLQGLERPTFGQRISSLQTIAQLLNPKTIVRNSIGNEMFYRIEQMNKILATPVDIARSKLFGKERTITFVSNNQGQYWKNFMSGGKAGWKGLNPMGLTTSYDISAPAFKSKFNPLTYLEKTLGATLRSFDNAAYMRAYNHSLGEMATLRAINEGLKGDAKKQAIQQYIREADVNMKNIADEYGKYVTFQDNTHLSNLLTKGKQGLNYVSTKAITLGMKPTKDFGLGDLILKYPKTPGNLIMRALEYSPAGFIRSGSLMKEAFKTKSPLATKEGTLAFTRAITGTAGFSLMGYVLADLGILTSKGDSDYEVATLERNAGKQPNSVNITALYRFINSGFDRKEAKLQKGDTLVSYDWAQPISMSIALGVGAYQAIKENKNPSTLDVAKSAVNSAADTIVNMSVLSGLNSLVSGYQGKTWTDKVEGVTKGTLGSFVPTALNQVRQLSDNTARTTYNPTFTGENVTRAKNRIPGAEQSLPPAYDTLGNQRETYQNGSNNAFNVLLNPSFVSKYEPTPEEKFIIDFIDKTGDKRPAPYLVDKKLDGKKLTAEQYAEFQRIMGLETQKGFQNVIPNLQGQTNYEQVSKILRKVLRDAGKTAREEIRADISK